MNHFDRFRIACSDFVSLMARLRLLGPASVDTPADGPKKGFHQLSVIMDSCWERCQHAGEAKPIVIRMRLRLKRAGSNPDVSCFMWLHYDLIKGFQVRRMTLIDHKNFQCQTIRFVKNEQVPGLTTIETLLQTRQGAKHYRRRH